jgi:ABC-type polysaccharide/polyol phosphate transport system ATPase subunit
LTPGGPADGGAGVYAMAMQSPGPSQELVVEQPQLVVPQPRELAILVQSVSKTFMIPEEKRSTLKERALHPRKKIAHRRFDALANINFSIDRGEFFGIVGRNGSGKSTLLKCIAGIYSVQGRMWAKGSMSTMIELGVGFNPELAARDNVVLNGIMLGLTPSEARRRYEEVIDFAELQEFEELKVKNYSSGMMVRLAFAAAIQVDADIMLIDEILAVGDANFQQKCFDVFNRMRDRGKTIIFVTHDMGSMVRFCERAMLLEQGEMVHIGDPQDVADRYLEINFGREPVAKTSTTDADERVGDGDARVMEVWVEDATGERRTAIRQGGQVTLRVRVSFNVEVEDPAASIYILNEEHKTVVVLSTNVLGGETGTFAAGAEVVFSFSFDNVLAPGRYSPLVALAHKGFALDTIDKFESTSTFIVTATQPMGGLVDVPVSVDVRSAATELTA